MIEAEEKKTDGQLSGVAGRAECRSRLCRLLSLVHEKRFGYVSGRCDCVCKREGSSPENWRSTGEALRWLENFVEKLPKQGAKDLAITESYVVDDWGDVTNRTIEIRVASSGQSTPGKST